MTRERICDLAACKLRVAAPSLSARRAVVGLDGFVDEIVAVVNKRGAEGDARMVQTIGDLGRKITSAAGKSSNYELVVRQRKLGGNGPLMAGALASLGLTVTCVGSLGYPAIHPVFADLAGRAAVIGIAEPGHTDALEFEDGKLMLNKLEALEEVNWDNLIARIGRDRLKTLLHDAHLIGMANWTMLPHMSRIWEKLLDEVIPGIERHQRKLFVDLADPEKRTHDDIVDALRLLTRFQDQVDVILGLNLKESQEIAAVLGLAGTADAKKAIVESAEAIRRHLGLYCVAIHPRHGAAAATEDRSAWFSGPFVARPKISTGAGDHFNAGFCLGQLIGMTLEESLCTGVATSGYFVRTGESPGAARLADFIARLPEPGI